jgi:FtsP/CotA-like multicopper oxidase with cupredoxin domain
VNLTRQRRWRGSQVLGAEWRPALKHLGVLSSALLALMSGSALASAQIPQTALPGRSIPKYVEPLPTFVGARVQAGTGYTVGMSEFQQEVLPHSFYASLPQPFNAGTYVWGYKVGNSPPHYPGFTVEAQVGTPVTVTYQNNLIQSDGSPPVLQKYITVDQTLHWADPLNVMCEFLTIPAQQGAGCFDPFAGSVPVAVHLHDGEVQSYFDGGPDEWFTPTGLRGPGYSSLPGANVNEAIYFYPNTQQATTLWFHDHALGATRTNVYSGMAAFYFLRDSFDTGLPNNALRLPAGEQEIEIAIQDRIFDTNGQLLFPDGFPSGPNGPPPNPDVHPFWIPEFFGDAIVVNGKTWPFLEVEPRRYRFRFLDGSNARMYGLALQNGGPPIWQIGTDGGLLDSPAKIAFPDRLFIAPGERADVIIDFTGVPLGAVFTLTNNAKAPFPKGTPPDPLTVGQIMQFRVVKPLSSTDTTCNPAVAGDCNLRPGHPIVRLSNPTTGSLNVTPDVRRQLVLNEVEGPGGPLQVLLNNTLWIGLKETTLTSGSPVPVTDSLQPTFVSLPSQQVVTSPNHLTELPRQGSTELWEIANITADAHPIHLHLVQVQIVNRQALSPKYARDWEAAFPNGFVPGDGPPRPYLTPNADGAVGGNIALSGYLQGPIMPPSPNEAGWKDTEVMHPGQVTRIIVRYAPTNLAAGTTIPGTNYYPFDPTAGPGYVWHCHIIDHEDNEMMRPYAVQP